MVLEYKCCKINFVSKCYNETKINFWALSNIKIQQSYSRPRDKSTTNKSPGRNAISNYFCIFVRKMLANSLIAIFKFIVTYNYNMTDYIYLIVGMMLTTVAWNLDQSMIHIKHAVSSMSFSVFIVTFFVRHVDFFFWAKRILCTVMFSL